MTKVKYVIIIMLIGMLILLVPNISNATEKTYTDNTQNIEWAYEEDEDGNIINLKCKTTDKMGKVTIPNNINGKTVISLKGSSISFSEGAFAECTGITEVEIPNTIKTISKAAFYKCTGLNSVVIPESVTKIEGYAFSGCIGLKAINLPKNLIEIGVSAFHNCSGLTSLTIPDSVTTMGEGAFENCSGIKDLKLSNHLTAINNKTFMNCKGLTSVVIPDGVTTIDGEDPLTMLCGSFGNCTNLKKILIPDSVSTIGKDAFYGCTDLTIYGHDDEASKRFAQEHQISFDYIENWEETGSGSDISAPTVKEIMVTLSSISQYNRDDDKKMYIVPTDAKLVINVVFSETISGTTAPTLTIKFGDGDNIQLTNGTIGGSTISYTYTVKSTDKGVLTTVSYSGGDIKDTVGNVASLSCPALTIELGFTDYVYANGTASGTTTNPNGDENNGGSANNGGNGGSSNGKDDTVANGKIPQTGAGIGIVVSIIATIGVTIFAYIKTRKYKGI